ncbi:MAG: hypothetical protein FJ119_06845 [Deltaproteobacteria bacterium]|nr:hypothetical protein [Deltaproteobacteria bacterium]
MDTMAHTLWQGLDLTHYLALFSVPGAFAPFQGWLNISLGVLLCFFGARLFGVSVVCVSGLLAGLGSYVWLAARIDSNPALVIALIAAVLCALVVRSLLRIGFFLLGVVLGGSISGTFLGDSIWVVAVMLASGIVSMLMYRAFIGLICAALGSLLLANGLLAWIAPEALSNRYMFPGMVALLFTIGFFFQAGFLRNHTDEPEDD